MHYMIIAIMMAVIAVIGMMLQRVFQGPTVYDRMNGLGVTGTDTILLIILFGYLDAVSYTHLRAHDTGAYLVSRLLL